MTASPAKYQKLQTTKIENTVTTEAQRQIIQKDLNALANSSEKWQMKFNLDKCHVLHIENYKLLDERHSKV